MMTTQIPVNMKCPNCTGQNWIHGSLDEICTLTITKVDPTTGTTTQTGRAIPAVPLSCAGCGYIILFNRQAAPKL